MVGKRLQIQISPKFSLFEMPMPFPGNPTAPATNRGIDFRQRLKPQQQPAKSPSGDYEIPIRGSPRKLLPPLTGGSRGSIDEGD